MISIVVCSVNQQRSQLHQAHIHQTIGVPHEYIRIDNSNNRYGICAAYNQGVRQALGEVVVFAHEDLFFLMPQWGGVLQRLFAQDHDLGLVGVAGTQYLMRHKPAWVAAGRPFIRGRVAHEMADGRQILTLFSAEEGTSEVVAVDGLFFAIRKSLFERIAFDEQTFSGFHFYDMDICMQVRRSHRLVVTSEILVKHLSGGNFGEAWKEAAIRFMDKYAAELPASCGSTLPDVTRRIDFESLDMASLLSPHALDVVRAVGH